ncbi:MAG TPA: LptF/LptG family permease [bacterium]|nr:LptF/LptG family permease [bacterium]
MILFRSIFRELVNPFLMTLLVMVGLLMTQQVYDLVNLVVERRLNLAEVGLMLVYLAPQVLDVTVPLAVVGAVFVVVIRQSMDAEVISLRATGRALWSYAAPFLIFGAIMTGVTAYVTVWLQPLASRLYQNLQVEMVRWRAEQKLVPGELNYDFGDKVIRVGGRKSAKELSDIFIASRHLGPTSSVITAHSGWIEVDDKAKRVVFRLKDGTVYTLSGDAPEFRTVNFDTMRYALNYKPVQIVDTHTLRSTPSSRLLANARDAAQSASARASALDELIRRVATPWVCLAFALASIPMAIIDPRSGRRAGYLRAIFLVVAYFVVWAAFKDLVGGGKAVPYAMFLPALLIFLYGMLRLWQMNADVDSLWRAFRR